MTAHQTDGKQDGPGRKPYERPRLEVYGDIREVTNSYGKKGKNDGGRPPRSRTQ